jgi:hypothetical protein
MPKGVCSMRTPYDSSATKTPKETREAVTVRLGPMAAEALSASGQPRAERLEKTLVQAIAYYVGPARDTTGWAYPKFLVPDSEPAGRMAVRIEGVVWERIAAEAKRQEVEPDALVQHAALFFGAARDAGQLTDQILHELEQKPFSSARSAAG